MTQILDLPLGATFVPNIADDAGTEVDCRHWQTVGKTGVDAPHWLDEEVASWAI